MEASLLQTQDSVFHSFGLLEHILSYAEVRDLVVATEINQRWKEAGRSNVIWYAICERKMILKTEEIAKEGEEKREMPLFWRSSFSSEVIDQLTVRQIRSLFDHYLLRDQKAELAHCLEKKEMKALVQLYQNRHLSGHYPFTSLWFASYASCIVDSRRTRMLRQEVCNPHGFNVFFKVLEEEVLDDTDMAELIPYENHPGILLYPHSVCRFLPDGTFDMTPMHPHTRFRWRLEERPGGRRTHIHVGPYPPLVATREVWKEKNDRELRWKLENVHVVLRFRTTPREDSSL